MRVPWKKAAAWGGALFAAALLAAAGSLVYVYYSAKTTADHIYEPRKAPAYVRSAPASAQDGKGGPIRVSAGKTAGAGNEADPEHPFTVLLLGVDRRTNDVGRSDTIVVMSVNPGTKSILLFSIPRDTRTEIVGRGTVDKINHAFAFGGVDMAIQTVEKFLDYPIDYYVKVDMEEFSRIVDILGGVEVHNPFAFSMHGRTFEKGTLTLSGSEALLYSRMRYDDPKGDLGRNARQRDLIAGLMRKAVRAGTLVRADSLFKQVEQSVRTNMKFEFLRACMTERMDQYALTTMEIKGSGRMIDGIWYYMVDAGERERVHERLQNSMETA
ncbi:LCP family protein [Cohnella caldifontis]|uniref:LCP family glycopolymer transferase n=1 Tax=Cohnella caldifontis TaxID=3027471 RepID=UPI0023EE067C|nr:LCP family protein [Cohnella sp. YIM B05605]